MIQDDKPPRATGTRGFFNGGKWFQQRTMVAVDFPAWTTR